MTCEELIAAAKATVIDEQQINEMQVRLKEAEREFEQEFKAPVAEKEFLARIYSL